MATSASVKNNERKPSKITIAIFSHLNIKSRNGCLNCTDPQLSSSFEIMSTVEAMKTERPSFLDSFLYNRGDDSIKSDSWTVEDNDYIMLRGKLSRVHSAPPSEQLRRIFWASPSKFVGFSTCS